ncbi:MAG TPA: alpha/beta hydrolase [Blastocatellia bacterium]|nr:alpha/beta hydrolase [Blastocatellia bacterium]
MSEPQNTDIAKPKRGRWRRIFKRLLITLIILALVMLFGVIPWGLAALVTGAGTRPMDRNLTQTPADFGAQFKDVEFLTSDNVKISGWLVRSGDKHATIVYSHGLFRSRRELLERAMELNKLGYGALLYDSRNHGDSGSAKVSLGYNERLDVEGAVRFLRQELGQSERIVSFGISMGATAALLCAAETPDVAAVVSDSSFLSFDHTVDHHLRLFLKLPPFPIGNELKYFIQNRASFEGSKLDALDAVRRIGDRPIMFIAAAHDKRMPPDIAQQLYQACTSPKRQLLVVEGPQDNIHGHAYQSNPQLYIESVAQFLQSVGMGVGG